MSALWGETHVAATRCSLLLLLLLLLLPLLMLQRQRRAVEAVYEARPMAKDHQVPGDMQGAHWNVS